MCVCSASKAPLFPNLQVVDGSVAREAADVVLHSVVLMRALGALDIVNDDAERYAAGLGMYYRTCGAPSVAALIDDAVANMEDVLAAHRAAEFTLSFYERHDKPALLGFTTVSERHVFEQWRWILRLPPTVVRRSSVASSGSGGSGGVGGGGTATTPTATAAGGQRGGALAAADAEAIAEQAEGLRRLLLEVSMRACGETAHLPRVPLDATFPLTYAATLDVRPPPPGALLPPVAAAALGAASAPSGGASPRAPASPAGGGSAGSPTVPPLPPLPPPAGTSSGTGTGGGIAMIGSPAAASSGGGGGRRPPGPAGAAGPPLPAEPRTRASSLSLLADVFKFGR